MTTRFKHDRIARLEKKLRAYSRQANSPSGFHPGARTMQYSALAAIVPLAASVGAASAQTVQCRTMVPTGTINLSVAGGTGTNPRSVVFGFPTTLGSVSLGGSVSNSFLGLIATADWAPAATGVNLIGYRALSSDTFTSSALNLESVAFICSNNGTALTGNFCPPSGPGFLPVGTTGGPGFIELEVLSMGGGQASLAFQFFQFGSPPAHAGDCPVALPVELTSFVGLVDDGIPVLSWETASELNNAGFEIQRSSSGDVFRKVAFMEGHGTTVEAQSYRFADKSAHPNSLYRYRLKQIDLDGTTSYSQILEVFTEVPNAVAVSHVYPNPVNGRGARLNINLVESANAVIETFDVRGAMVMTNTRVLSRGSNRVSIETEGLARGSHFVKVQVGEQIVYRPFVVLE